MERNKKDLSIRNKLLIIFTSCLIIFSIAIYIFSSQFLIKSFAKLEEDQIVRNLHRVEFSIKNNINNQSIKLKDWAFWDDTYNFIVDRNKKYIESNLTNESLTSLQINAVVFINNKDEIVYLKFVDIETGKDLPQENLVYFIKQNIDSIKSLNNIDSLRHIIKLPEGDMMISVDNILKSDQSGDSRGIMIFGTFINKRMIENISGLVGFPVSIYPYNSYTDVTDVIIAKNSLSSGKVKYLVHLMPNNLVHGDSLIYDINNKPADIIRVESPREIYQKGKNTVVYFLVVIIISIILFGILIFILLEKSIISRLIRLGEGVEEIGKSGDFSKEIIPGSNDEIGRLTTIINKMFKEIKASDEREKKINEMEKITLEKNKIHAEETEKLNKLMIGRELKMIELKKENLKLKGDQKN